MANMIADPANVDDGKWPHLAAVLNLNGRHTVWHGWHGQCDM